MTATKRDYCNGGYVDIMCVQLAGGYVFSCGQIITASSSYIPTSVKFKIFKTGSSPPTTYVSIYTLGSVLVASGIIDNSLISVGFPYVEITVNLTTINANVLSGYQYYILIEPQNNAGDALVFYKSAGYDGGEAYYREGYIPAAVWSAFPGYDLWFEVWGIDRDNVLTTSLKTNSRNNAVIFGG